MHILLGLARAGKCSMTSINDKWYVGQVLAGKEASTLSQCRKLIDPSILHESFVPEFETMWKSSAGWRPERRLLFPGYLFFVTDNIEALAAGLTNVPNRVRILGDEENLFMALSDAERDWFLAFIDQDRVVRMSEGVIENDQVRITKGPLMGKEARIRKVDRHKRCAFVEVRPQNHRPRRPGDRTQDVAASAPHAARYRTPAGYSPAGVLLSGGGGAPIPEIM